MGNLSGTRQKLLYTAEKKLINELVNNNCVVVFSKTQCIYCKKVKKLFDGSNITFLNVELDKRDDGKNLQDALLEVTGAKTVPRIFINGKCIGGASDAEQLHKQSQLLEKILECGVRERI